MEKSLNHRQIFLLLIGFLIIHSFGSRLLSQDIRTERVRFSSGESSATVEASISGQEIVDYLLNVRAGQYMNVSMATDNAQNYFNIMEPGEEYTAIHVGSTVGNQFEGKTAKSGDYRIRVYLMRAAARRGEDAGFRLEMIVAPASDPGTSDDALVGETGYHATGMVPCIMGDGEATGNCDFGVIREGNGSGTVTITKPDGRTRTIFFEDGNATGYDRSQADPGEFSASREGDMYIIKIGDEQYEIPEAVIYGG